jgi:hypothetical protein
MVDGTGWAPVEDALTIDRTRRGLAMCLTCGCMDAHLEMGEHNVRYEDIKAAADENGRSVAETLDIMDRTVARDRKDHAGEYEPN